MKLLVTVGTTAFEGLISAVDRSIVLPEYEVTVQHYTGKPSEKYSSIDYFEDILPVYLSSDVVVTHAGAASVYTLLELRKKVIVVPNLERIDKHQLEIADFIARKNYGIVCRKPEQLDESLLRIKHFTPSHYEKIDFFKFNDICHLL